MSGCGTSLPEPVSAPSRSEAGKPDDDLARLGDRIAELAAGINAAEAQMMTLIADFDRRGGWKDGFGSCAEWLAWRIGIKIGPARERVRAARALENLPRDAELTAEQARHRSRAFSVFVDGDGMYVVKGRLEPEVGAVLMRAVEAASDALFRGEDGAARGGRDAGRRGGSAATRERGRDDPRPKPKQRRADAVGLLAERALAACFGSGEPSATPDDGSTAGSDSERQAKSGTRAERYQVMVHCDAATLREDVGGCAETSLERPGPGPVSSSRRPVDGRGCRALERGRALSRFRYPLAHRGRRARSRGGISGMTTQHSVSRSLTAGSAPCRGRRAS